MIYEFALEPALVASWGVDRNAYRFFDGKFGIGARRIASAYPGKGEWRRMVMDAFDDSFSHVEPEQGTCSRCREKQAARCRVDVLLNSISHEMVERQGAKPTTWRDGAVREHSMRGFQGILVSTPSRPSPPILCADDIEEATLDWNPPAPPTPRRVADIVRVLEPLLRFASEVRFVDPYLDPRRPAFFDSLAALVRCAQAPAGRGALRLEFHTGLARERLTGQSTKAEDIALEVVNACRRAFAPVLRRGTSLRVFAWSDAVVGADKIHNRYVLTNVGSVSVPGGLDRAPPKQEHTDDLTLLSREQHLARWTQYSERSQRLKCVLGPEVVEGTG